MRYETKSFKNGKRRGYLVFGNGDRVVFRGKALEEFESKIARWLFGAEAKARGEQGELLLISEGRVR